MPNLDRCVPFFHKRGPVGVLLIHGYTDGPSTLATLGQKLADAGYTVRCDLLPGHGRDPAELNELGWRDWREAVLGSVDPRPYWAHWLKYVIRMVPKTYGPDVKCDVARADYAGYDTTPVAGVAQVMQLIRHVTDDLPAVRCPILVMHGAEDHTVPLANARQIIDSVSSSTKKLVVLPDSYHVISVDRDRLRLEDEVLSFVASELAKRAGR